MSSVKFSVLELYFQKKKQTQKQIDVQTLMMGTIPFLMAIMYVMKFLMMHPSPRKKL